MQVAMDSVAVSAPTLAGTKHNRPLDAEGSDQPAPKRRTVDEAMAEYKREEARYQQLRAQRTELKRQKAELVAKINALPHPNHWQYCVKGRLVEQVRDAYREVPGRLFPLNYEQYDKQTCPLCKYTPQRRNSTRELFCKHCNQDYHLCTTDFQRNVYFCAKGPHRDCLGCWKPL